MMVLQNEKTKEIKRVYTGKEIIIAMGKKYQNLHDLYKEHYNEYFELFGDEEEGYIPLTKMPLFDSEEEFYYCLAEGNKDIYRIERLNKKKFKDKDGKYIKVRNINELKRYKNKFLSSIYSIISYMLGVALGVLLVGICLFLASIFFTKNKIILVKNEK